MLFCRIIIPAFGTCLAIAGIAGAETLGVQLAVSEIMQKVDSISSHQDSLLSTTKYRVREQSVFNEVDDRGRVKNSDTVIAVITMQGHDEVSREIISSTKDDAGEKKEGKQEVGASLNFADPRYNFLLTVSSDSSYIIAVSPKDTPRDGDVSGKMVVDRQTFFTKRIELMMPRPGGALKEFATEVVYEPLEGGLLMLKEVRMSGFAKAFLGIFKIRFTTHLLYSDYEILP